MKLSNKKPKGLSFNRTKITSTVLNLIQILGNPQYAKNDGNKETNFEWICELDSGEVFKIYDWKEFKSLDFDEPITFRIDGINQLITDIAKEEIENKLKNEN